MYHVVSDCFNYVYDNEKQALDKMVELMQSGIGFNLVITPF